MVAMNEFTALARPQPAEAGWGRAARLSGLGIAGGEFIRCCLSRARADGVHVRARIAERPGPAMNAGHE